MFVNPQVSLRQVSKKDWELLESLYYEGAYEEFTVPVEFRTDFASVPRLASWLVPTYGLYTPAAILHDYLWRNPGIVSPEDTDGIFRRTLREAGVSFPKRWVMWAAVRAGSRLRGITPPAFLAFLVAFVLGVAFVAVPAIIVQVWLIAFWLIELLSWGVGRLFGRKRPRPIFEFEITT